jgi:hypothetical protein
MIMLKQNNVVLSNLSQIAIQSEDAINRLVRMLKIVGHKAELFNGYRANKKAEQTAAINEASIDVLEELLMFLRELTKFFRGDAFGTIT